MIPGTRFIQLLIFSLIPLVSTCSEKGKESDVPLIEQDGEDPVILCSDPIQVYVPADKEGAKVGYTAPKGSDNFPGATTEQTQGLASGSVFPLGTTTNTYVVTDAAGNTASCSFDVTVSYPSENGPYSLEGGVKIPEGKKWIKVGALSDEFNDDSFDEAKWLNTDPSGWIGRPPGLFKKNTVSQADGNLRLTPYLLASPVVVKGNTFTHAGSNITSKKIAQVGYYVECRMKANKTFMSSTFWLINKRNEGTECEVRTTELDIQECVGQITGTADWIEGFNLQMNSNTHSRNTTCDKTPTGSIGGHALLGGKATDAYHVYAAWWKSPREIEFYLDGKKVNTVTPEANFNLPMYVKMVVETYNWNPVPADEGMNGTVEERTTFYDWVRTWKLEDK